MLKTTTEKLRINRADRAASKQSGLPALFYTIRRKFGDDTAQIYLNQYNRAQTRNQ